MVQFSPRLKTKILLDGLIRTCNDRGFPAYLAHSGYENSGTILLKIVGEGFRCRVFSQRRNMDGALEWYDVRGDLMLETEADQHVKQAIDRDPDLWVVEIEDMRGTLPPFKDRDFWPAMDG